MPLWCVHGRLYLYVWPADMPAGIALYGRPVQHTDDQELSWPTEYFPCFNKHCISKLMWQSINLEGY